MISLRLFAVCCLCLFAICEVSAGGRRSRRAGNCYPGSCQVVQGVQSCQGGQCSVVASPLPQPLTPTASPSKVTGQSCDDALAEVNAARAQRGLKPYINDPVLNKAARKCAERRAAIHCEGHCPESDFAYLDPVYPVGTCVGGCAAWEPSWGWGACATYDNYTYCGAAWVMGSDGKRYMHLFCR